MAERETRREELGRHEEQEARRSQGQMTVEEAGHLGGQRVRELIQEGKEAEGERRKET